jgi:hypothetical protein
MATQSVAVVTPEQPKTLSVLEYCRQRNISFTHCYNELRLGKLRGFKDATGQWRIIAEEAEAR